MASKFVIMQHVAAILILCCTWVCMVACDPNPMHDFGNVRVPSSASDLVFTAFRPVPGKPLEEVAANVDTWPLLEGLGIASRRLVFPPCGQVSPHTHPRATEMCVVLSGEVDVGLFTSNETTYTQVMRNHLVYGDIMVFPQGLVHWMQNFGTKQAVLYCGLNSADPGYNLLNVQLFGSTTKTPDVVLRSCFGLSAEQVREIKASTPLDDDYPRSGCVPGVRPNDEDFKKTATHSFLRKLRH